MNLTIATVLSCTDDGCQVQPLDANMPLATNYSAKIKEYNIPIRPTQFVIVDNEPSPPETLFRFSRATVRVVEDDHLKLDDNGQPLLATGGANLVTLHPGDEVLLIGYNDENRRVIDLIVDGKPVHFDQLAADWFPEMVNYRS